MEYIQLSKWERKEHFLFFKQQGDPHFSLNINLDVTNFVSCLKKRGLPFYFTMIFFCTKVANEMIEFRYKIRGDQIVLHDKLHPSFTDLEKGQTLFKIITASMTDDLENFITAVKEKSKQQKEYFNFEQEGRDDLIYFSCLPWVSYTSLSPNKTLNKTDSIPRFIWGKYFESDNKLLLPFTLGANHCLLDGWHVAQYLKKLQEQLDTFS
mgnify:CR=1 FL=1